jgi:hypothetical protein
MVCADGSEAGWRNVLFVSFQDIVKIKHVKIEGEVEV